MSDAISWPERRRDLKQANSTTSVHGVLRMGGLKEGNSVLSKDRMSSAGGVAIHPIERVQRGKN